MKIEESIINQIKNVYRFSAFKERSEEVLLKTFRTPIHDSNTLLAVLDMDGIKIERVDDYHDKLILIYDNYRVEALATWSISHDKYILHDLKVM